MSRSKDTSRAKAFVQNIATSHCCLEEKDLEGLSPEQRQKMEGPLLKTELMTGPSIIRLTEDLYLGKARFVSELIRNADDNCYSKALKENVAPYVSFDVYPDRVVFCCNDDGFTRDDVSALCSVGKDAIGATQGSARRRCIGLRSAFTIASKAHIESGDFSFSLGRQRVDSGIGMITPIWEEPGHRLTTGTKITLHLHDASDNPERVSVHENIREQLDEVPDNILLFTKNIRRIRITYYNGDKSRLFSRNVHIYRPQPNRAIIRRLAFEDCVSKKTLSHFQVTTHHTTYPDQQEKSTYSYLEDNNQTSSKSTVILAFPLSDREMPIVEPQGVFALFPVGKAGFSFLAHAHFVTDSSGWELVEDSPHNAGLVDAIAEGFVIGVLQFCQHEALRYLWMRYLPDRRTTKGKGLWLRVVDKIYNVLKRTPVVYNRKTFRPRQIGSLFRVSSNALNDCVNVLFKNGESEHIISKGYSDADLDILQSCDLRCASDEDVVEWLRFNVLKEITTPTQSREHSESYWLRMTSVLRTLNKRLNASVALNNIELVPLERGTWVSMSSGPIYFNTVDGHTIPSGIGLKLTSWYLKSECLGFYKELGVLSAAPDRVRRHIFRQYSAKRLPPVTIEDSVSHLNFLYGTETAYNSKKHNVRPIILDDYEVHVDPTRTWVYGKNNDPYGPWELLRPTPPGPNLGASAPGLRTHFAHRQYFWNMPRSPVAHTLSWLEWLRQRIGISDHIHFSAKDGQLDESPRYIQRYRPEKFLGSLLTCHCSCRELSPELSASLSNTEVLCRDGRKVLFKNTYFPLKPLTQLVDSLVEPGAFFPWLWLDAQDTHEAPPPDWQRLLGDLGVGLPASGVDFALAMLRSSIDSSSIAIKLGSVTRLFRLYSHIQTQYESSQDRVAAKAKIRAFFQGRKCILVPRSSEGHLWAVPNQCLWVSPEEITTEFAFVCLNKPHLDLEPTEIQNCQIFFRTTLGIKDCTWHKIVQELVALDKLGLGNEAKMRSMYRDLDIASQGLTATSIDELKKQFEDHPLIFNPSKNGPLWRKVSQTVWSNSHDVGRRMSLDPHYPGLRHLFVEVLGVKTSDLQIAIDELKEMAAYPFRPASIAKKIIWTINSLLPTSQAVPSPQDVLKCQVLPIKWPNGFVTLEPTTTEFYVVDRKNLQQLFQKKVKLFDFTLPEVARLRPFLKWTGLEERYLSVSVKAATSLLVAGATPLIRPNLQIGDRASALVSVAVYFDSPRARSKANYSKLYSILRFLEFRETDAICSELSLAQDGAVHVVGDNRPTLHMYDNPLGLLTIFLPRSLDDQDYIFSNLLPQRLFEWIMTDPTTKALQSISDEGISATRSILLAPIQRLDMALEDNGIVATAIDGIFELAFKKDSSTTTALTDNHPLDSSNNPRRLSIRVAPVLGTSKAASRPPSQLTRPVYTG